MTEEVWFKLLSARSDLTDKLIHLTKESDEYGAAMDVLMKIFRECKLIGSPGKGGFQNETPMVCFQDTPIYPIAQMSNLIRQYAHSSKDEERLLYNYLKRYEGYGIRISKKKLFADGFRPTIYLDTRNGEEKIVSKEEQWRTLELNLLNPIYYIDWTHEREWIKKDDYEFSYDDVEIIVPDYESRTDFIKRCLENDMLKEALYRIKGIVVLDSIIN